jgi:hypothetical protein
MADLRRRRGRPPVAPGETSVPLSIRVGGTLYDALSANARAHGQDVSLFVREFLMRQFCTEKSTTVVQ